MKSSSHARRTMPRLMGGPATELESSKMQTLVDEETAQDAGPVKKSKRSLEDKSNNASAAKRKKRNDTRAAPTLPWMKVPTKIELGAGVQLDGVRGLRPALKSALLKGKLATIKIVKSWVWLTSFLTVKLESSGRLLTHGGMSHDHRLFCDEHNHIRAMVLQFVQPLSKSSGASRQDWLLLSKLGCMIGHDAIVRLAI